MNADEPISTWVNTNNGGPDDKIQNSIHIHKILSIYLFLHTILTILIGMLYINIELWCCGIASWVVLNVNKFIRF